MKSSVFLLSLIIGSSAFAGDAVPFDYPELLPAALMTMTEARKLIERTDLIKEEVLVKTAEIKRTKSNQLAGWVEYKKNIIEQGRLAIDACNKVSDCVVKANKKLSDEIGSAHEKIREVNAFFDKKLEAEQVVVTRKIDALTKVLAATKNAVIANAIQVQAVAENGNSDFVLESNLMLETITNALAAEKYLHDNIDATTWGWNVSDSYTYTFAAFYFRTSKKQNHIYLFLNPNRGRTYSEIKEDLLNPTSETDTTIFGLRKIGLFKEIIATGSGTFQYSMPCLGAEKEPRKACVAVLKNDSVSLE